MTKNIFSLEGYCSIVTGAARGLGKSMANALADAGSNIVIADIREEEAQETAKEIEKKGVKSLVVKVNVTNKDNIKDMVKVVLDKFKRIDVLLNNAGICKVIKAEEMDYKDWLEVINVNLNGVFLMSQVVGIVMIEQKEGSIINISSISGVVVNTPQTHSSYNVSKAGVIMLTKSLASEWARYNIRVNTIAPGYTTAGMARPAIEENGEEYKRWLSLIPMGRCGEPDELGGMVVYLASKASSYCTGGVYMVDGGYTVW